MTVVINITSPAATRNIPATLPALLFLISAFLAGGYYESTYSLLAALVWLGLARGRGAARCAEAVGGDARPARSFGSSRGDTPPPLTGRSAIGGPALRAAPLVALYAGALLAAE